MVCVAYLRTSSLSNVEGDSQERQQTAIRVYAERNGLTILAEYYDGGVSGTVPVDARPEFCRMLKERLADTILVETASRFARDLIVQEIGHQMLKEGGIELIAVDDPDSFTEDTPTAVMIRQVLGAVSQFEKAMVVKRLRSGLDRKAKELGYRIEGNGGYARKSPHQPEFARWYRTRHPELPIMAKQIKAISPLFTLRDVANVLAGQGYTRPNGEPFYPATVARWVS